MTATIPLTEWVNDDALGLLTAIGVRLTTEYRYATGGAMARGEAWELPVGEHPAPVHLVVHLVAEADTEGIAVCFQLLLRIEAKEHVIGSGRWHPAEAIQSYWREFEDKVNGQFLHLAIASLARLTRCTGCNWQEARCHAKQLREQMQVCCFHCQHPLILRRTQP